MELRQLRYFAAVARTGNFTRAATACHVSQPSPRRDIIAYCPQAGGKEIPLVQKLRQMLRAEMPADLPLLEASAPTPGPRPRRRRAKRSGR